MSEKVRRRAGRKIRTIGAIVQPAWNPVHYKRAPILILNEDQIESIHHTALKILQEIGMTVLAPTAREKFAGAGFDVDTSSERVRFAADRIESLVSRSPSSGTVMLHFRLWAGLPM